MMSSWLIPSTSPLPALPILPASHGFPILTWGAPPSLLLLRNPPNCSLFETGCDGPRPHQGRPSKPKTNGGYSRRHRRKRKRKQKNSEISLNNNLPQRIDRPLGIANNIMKQQFSFKSRYHRTPDALRMSSLKLHPPPSAVPEYDTSLIAVLMPSPNSKYGKEILDTIFSDNCHELLKKSKSDIFLIGQNPGTTLDSFSPTSNYSPSSSNGEKDDVGSTNKDVPAGEKEANNSKSDSTPLGQPTVNTNTQYLTFINISEYHTPLAYDFPSPAKSSIADGVRNSFQSNTISKRFDLSSNNNRHFEGSDILLQDGQINLEINTPKRIFRKSQLSFAQRDISSGNNILQHKKNNLRKTMTEGKDREVANSAQPDDYHGRSDREDRINYNEENQNDQNEYYDPGLQLNGRPSSKVNDQELESRQDYPDYSSKDSQIDHGDDVQLQFTEEQTQKSDQEKENQQIDSVPEEQQLFHKSQDQQIKLKEKQTGETKVNEKFTLTTIPAKQFLSEEEEEELIRKEQITFPQKTQQGTVVFGKGKGKMKPNRGGEEESEDGRKEWDRLGQLIIVVLLAALGTMGNTFAIAALVTEASLRKAGNILLANSMMASLLVTACVLPAGVVELLAGWSDPTPVCKPTWALTILAAHVALITLPCLAWENHARQHSPRPLPGCVLVAMIIATWCAAFSLTAAQWAGGYGPTHCEEHTKVSHASMTACVGVPLVVIPITIMVIVHAHTLLRTPTTTTTRLGDPECSSTEISTSPKNKEPQKDLALVATNLAVGLVTGSLWAGGVAIDWWGTSEGRLNWLPSVAAASCGFLYAGHRPFRDAYYQLFHYCCCKTTVSMARRGRNEPPIELWSGYNASTTRTTTEHVRVHIIPPYNMYSQQSPRQPQQSTAKVSRPKERRHKPAKKEIYEL